MPALQFHPVFAQVQPTSDFLGDNPDGLLLAVDGIIRGMLADVQPQLEAAGWNLFWSLAVILVVWTGLKQAYSGGWDVWEFIRLIMALAIPWAMLNAYFEPLRLTAALPITLPGSDDPISFPELLTAQGVWVAAAINEGGGLAGFWSMIYGFAARTFQAFAAVFTNPEATLDLNLWGLVGAPAGFVLSLITLALSLAVMLIAVLAAAVGFAQVVFAQVAIAVLVLFGPLLIPFLLIDSLAFLFWGWCKSMITYGFYAAVVAGAFRVMMTMLEATSARVFEEVNLPALLASGGGDMIAALGDALLWLMVLLVASISAVMVFFRIPALAGSIVSGQAADAGAGQAVMTVVSTVIAGVKGAAAAGKAAAARKAAG